HAGQRPMGPLGARRHRQWLAWLVRWAITSVMITVEGRSILTGTIRFPASGAWSAILEIEAGEAIAGAVSLDLDGTTLAGHAHHSVVYGARQSVHVIGGAGGLSRRLRAQSYRAAPVSVPLGDIVRQVGET